MKHKKICAQENKHDVPIGVVNITHKGAISLTRHEMTLNDPTTEVCTVSVLLLLVAEE